MYRIAIIDDGINLSLFQDFLLPMSVKCLQVKGNSCVKQYMDFSGEINHGTVCAALLCEELREAGIHKQVEVISISILNMEQKQTVKALVSAINWSIENGVGLISLSLGITDLSAAKELCKVVKKAEAANVTIIAAGSNLGKLTYPACLSSVIGVRCLNENCNELCYRICEEPIDGINIEMSLPASKVLQKIRKYHFDNTFVANSLIPPIMAARITKLLLSSSSIVIEEVKEFVFRKKLNSIERMML